MTWEQFVNSEFNVDNSFGVNNVYGCIHLAWDEEVYEWQETLYYDEFIEYDVSKDDVIIAGGTYFGG